MINTRGQKHTIRLEVDLAADLTGFGSSPVVTEAHRRIAKHYSSPLLLGPPVGEDLLEMVAHMFTEEEAELVRHLPPLRPRTAARVAALAGRPVAEVRAVLDRLSYTKRIVLAAGSRYAIMPIVPGTFEMALMTPDLSDRNSWHARFAALFEKIYESGFIIDYLKLHRAPVRYLPVGGAAKTLTMAWPSDKLEEVLAPYELFAVGHCQCRVSMQLVGKGCGRPTENCVGIGPMAKPAIERGLMRQAGRDEVIDIKRKAESEGCVTWMMNETGDWRGNISCSCCGCCCHAMRTIGEFNTPGLISRPHFLPRLKAENCNLCQKCVKICPMGAYSIVGDALVFEEVRCVGCGLCATNCKFSALEMIPVPDAPKPENGWLPLLIKMAPGYLGAGVKVWARRLFG